MNQEHGNVFNILFIEQIPQIHFKFFYVQLIQNHDLEVFRYKLNFNFYWLFLISKIKKNLLSII